jgi:hypothetical protein
MKCESHKSFPYFNSEFGKKSETFDVSEKSCTFALLNKKTKHDHCTH